jgi:phenol 2-monooxygenase
MTLQFYLNGYRPGDPLIREAPASLDRPGPGLPRTVDVLIVGCGPAGLVLAAQLANFPDIRTAVIDRKDGPLAVGQADGVACRTVEMFEAFGLAGRLLNEAYWVNEVCFWRPDPDDPASIRRAQRIPDRQPGLSEFPHVIVNQARMLTYLRDHMRRSPTRLAPIYGLELVDLRIDPDPLCDYPVSATVSHTPQLAHGATASRIQARYVVGCDGSRSKTRSLIGRRMVGDRTRERWGVMDVLAVTDFPDIRLKCAIFSAEGNILIIPREGGYLVRLYVELSAVTDTTMLDTEEVTPQTLAAIANRIMHPYTIEVKDVGWWSVYEIGHALCDKFDDVPAQEIAGRLPRVFIAGDACHTHSAKAGQGMNVSMADAWNLGWKLACVLRGTARPQLLHTYSVERRAVAQELIDFDREFSRLFSASAARSSQTAVTATIPERFREYFEAQGRFTAGVATRYAPSMLTGPSTFQHLARRFEIGMRFHSAPVIRLADARPMHLGHVAQADGAWRMYVFADQEPPASRRSLAGALCQFLESHESPIRRFTPPGEDLDSVIDVRGVFQQGPHEIAIEHLPSVLLPRKGRFALIDYEKVFCPDPDAGDIYDLREINRPTGCIVIVRPDQYVSHVLPLDRHDLLADFFSGILVQQSASRVGST